MSSYLNAINIEPISQNLTILFFIELVILVVLLIVVITYRNILVGGFKFYVLGIAALIIIIGCLVIQDSNNTASDIFMFTLDLVILPAILVVIVIVKILYEKFISKSSIATTNVPKLSAGESQILGTQPTINKTMNYSTASSGGGKKKRRSSRRKGLAFY